MLVYLLQITAVGLFAAILKPSDGQKANRRAYAITLCLALLMVAAVRDVSVGADTGQFCRAYERIGFEGIHAFDTVRYEPLFTSLCLLLNGVTDNYQALIVVASAIALIPVARLIYAKSKDMPLSFFLYIASNMYFSSMNTMRQAIAIGIIALAIPRLLGGKWTLYAICVAVAALFHQSAIVALLLIPLTKLKFSKGVFAAYLAASVAAFLFSLQLSDIVAGFLGRDELYSEAYMGSNYFGALFQSAVALACCLLCANYFAFSKRIGRSETTDSVYMHAMMLWFFFSVFSMQVEIVGRLGSYFSLFAVLAIPDAIKRAPKEEGGIVGGVTRVAFFIYFVVICVARSEWFGVIPYVADFERFACIF